jgi:hypothetical protein
MFRFPQVKLKVVFSPDAESHQGYLVCKRAFQTHPRLARDGSLNNAFEALEI